MLLRLACLGVTNAFAMLRLLPMSDREKEVVRAEYCIRAGHRPDPGAALCS
ncbi:hypothetical protein ACFCX0_49375 [Streptomyces sp. NPDC056352]|uniref:hypothetical protein n=1 Tax=Streptomyces sp. NPDC056352 TaxID=3345791 RepID=UPI0035D7ADCA